MKIDPDRWYPNDAPELDIIAKSGTRARWRHEGRGPRYSKSGSLVIYHGRDLISYLEAGRVETDAAA